MSRYLLTLDLKEDPLLIREYIEYHQNVWPEVISSIVKARINQMQIYHVHTRLCMILEVSEEFSFEKKSAMDSENPKVQEWEAIMDKYQSRLPFSKKGEKWVLLDKIFDLEEAKK